MCCSDSWSVVAALERCAWLETVSVAIVRLGLEVAEGWGTRGEGQAFTMHSTFRLLPGTCENKKTTAWRGPDARHLQHFLNELRRDRVKLNGLWFVFLC